jgi:hypothetical protein
MTLAPHMTPAVLFALVTSGFGACVGAIIAARAEQKRKRSQRVLAIHVRLETEWKNARMRMYLSGPIGPAHIPGAKYSSDSTSADSMRYIAGGTK